VEVTVQEVAFDEIRDQLSTAGPAGDGPDVIVGAHDWLGQLAGDGVVAPIDLGGKENEFQPVAIQAFTYDGQLHGVPYAVENVALVRNTELVPEAPDSFEDLTETALKLQDDGMVDVPLAMQVPDPYHQYPLFTAHGGYVFAENPDGTYDPQDLGIDSPGGLEAARSFDQWTKAGLIGADVNYDVMIESFAGGKAPFAITGPWAVSDPDRGFKARGVPYVVEPIPPIGGGTPRVFVGVHGFMISAFASNPMAAQTFLVDYMATQDAQFQLSEAGARLPALVAAFELASSDPDIVGFGRTAENGDPLPAIPEMESVWSAWTDAYANIFQQQVEPEKAFMDAAEQIRALIPSG
jgi:arabinogalactan oligomer/maltooligosaccharide transport system substrate-binding protein